MLVVALVNSNPSQAVSDCTGKGTESSLMELSGNFRGVYGVFFKAISYQKEKCASTIVGLSVCVVCVFSGFFSKIFFTNFFDEKLGIFGKIVFF